MSAGDGASRPAAGRDALLRPGGSGGGTAAPIGRMVAAQLAMELRLTARRGENLLATLVLPVVLLVFFATVPVLAPGGGARRARRPSRRSCRASSRSPSSRPAS